MNLNTGIYCIKNLANGNCYIGSSVNIRLRWHEHKYELKNNKHHSRHLQNAYNKYGIELFEFKILINCEVCELLTIEQQFIDSFKPKYNVLKLAGSPLGCKRTEESKRNMSIAQKGKIVTEETKRNMSIAQTGKVLSNKTKEKISKYHTGKIITNETKQKISIARLGIVFSEKTKRKMSIAQTGRTCSEETKRKVSLAVLGRKHSEESKRKMSLAQKDRITSDETKQKQSLAHLGYKASDETKKKMSLRVSGDKSPTAKLTWELVNEIRELYATRKFSQRKLAKLFNVTQPNIGAIVRNETWIVNN
jgi:group I intron endonuclease